MLEKIQRTVTLEEKTVAMEDDEESGPVDLDSVYRSLPVLRKLIIFIQFVLTGKPREELVQELLIRRLAIHISKNYPGLVDFRTGIALTPMYDLLLKLRNSAQFFAGSIGRAGGRERPTFLSFLLALEAPEVHAALQSGIDPEKVDEAGSDNPDTQIRHRMVSNVESTLNDVADSVRYRMRRGNRFLDVMGKLGFFPFEKLLNPFRPAVDGAELQASLLNLRESFPQLAPIARSLGVTPSPACLEALILFHQGYEFADTVEDSVLGERLKKAAGHLKTLQEVASKVPFLDLSRYLLEDVNFTAPPIQGGEEWIAIVRRFWRDRAEEAYRIYKYHRQKDALVRDADELTGSATVSPIPEYPKQESGAVGRHALSLALLRALLQHAWQQEIFPHLKTLYIEGEFYKDDNRAEFSESYSSLAHLVDKIDGFRTRVSMQGDLGRALHDIDQELTALPVKRRKRQDIISQIDEHAESLIKSAINSFTTITKILNGVLFGEVGGRYDTLSNIRDIGGRHNRSYVAALEHALQLGQSAADTLSRLYDLERAQSQSSSFDPVTVRV
jgi:hypothetical protein